jgi:hypothetical protein
MEQLNITQEVLRGLMISIIAAVPDIDRAALAKALSAFATHPVISAEARIMLNDLAAGATALAPAANRSS